MVDVLVRRRRLRCRRYERERERVEAKRRPSTLLYRTYSSLVLCILYRAVISCFTAFEVFGDVLISWLPFYYEAKIVFIMYLVFHRKAAVTFYRKYLHPTLENYEGKIDQGIDEAAREAQRGTAHVAKLGIKALRSHSATLLHIGQKALESTATLAAKADGEEGEEKKK